MAKYIVKRILLAILTIFIVSVITFFAMNLIPGGPFNTEKAMSPAVIAALNERYGLDDPVPVQYVKYLGNLLKGDMGVSFKRQVTTVNQLIANGFPLSAKVGAWGVALALAAGIPLGIVAAVKRGKLPDGASMVFATIGVSVPSFVVCVLLMYLFCEKW